MRVWEHIKQGVGARNLNSYELVQAEQSWIDDLFACCHNDFSFMCRRSEIPVYSFLYLTRLYFDFWSSLRVVTLKTFYC